ncbi:MAG: Uma2 family endonuclease [Labilithrix sp.]|nr:Uma2 family endonuclease [Labilithrix sp.]
MSATSSSKMGPSDYLAWERAQAGKHQYVGGEIFAMAGGSPRHNFLSGRIWSRFDAAPCRPLSSDQKVHIPRSGNFLYPDCTVVCGPVQLYARASDVIENPRVVVEVLSQSTEHHDRGDKWQDYRSIESLTDYVLVSQRMAHIEHFARESEGSWKYRDAGAGGRLELTTGAVLVVDEIYAGAFDLPGDE